MKKVCIITSVHPHDDIRIYHRQAIALSDAGYQVLLINPHHEGENEKVRFIRVRQSNNTIYRVMTAARRLRRVSLDVNAAVYHLHDPELLPLGRFLKRHGKTVVFDLHEDLPKQIMHKSWIPASLRKPLSKIAANYQHKSCRLFDINLAATPQIAATVPNCEVLCNYPDEREIIDPEGYIQRENKVCYIGAITEDRGIFNMLSACYLAGVTLVLAGRFENRELEMRVRAMQEFSCVDYRGFVGREEISRLLGECRIGLLLLKPTTNYLESMPIKLFEYMMAGLPVIASDFPFWRELISTSCAKFVDPNNPNQIAQAIAELFQKPDVAQKMGQQARKIALKEYSYVSQREKLITLYGRLTKEGAR